jgi:hypothetical protein
LCVSRRLPDLRDYGLTLLDWPTRAKLLLTLADDWSMPAEWLFAVSKKKTRPIAAP